MELIPEVYFGTTEPVDWRSQVEDEPDDDEERPTPPEVVAMLGFDPVGEEPLAKAHVRAHTRRTPKGGVAQVREHEDKRTRKRGPNIRAGMVFRHARVLGESREPALCEVTRVTDGVVYYKHSGEKKAKAYFDIDQADRYVKEWVAPDSARDSAEPAVGDLVVAQGTPSNDLSEAFGGGGTLRGIYLGNNIVFDATRKGNFIAKPGTVRTEQGATEETRRAAAKENEKRARRREAQSRKERAERERHEAAWASNVRAVEQSIGAWAKALGGGHFVVAKTAMANPKTAKKVEGTYAKLKALGYRFFDDRWGGPGKPGVSKDFPDVLFHRDDANVYITVGLLGHAPPHPRLALRKSTFIEAEVRARAQAAVDKFHADLKRIVGPDAKAQHGPRSLQGRTEFKGIPIAVENRRGSFRTWHDPENDTTGHTRMEHPYGYFQGTVGLDGDAVDCFVGPDHEAPVAYIVTTRKAPDFDEVDEQKVLLGDDPRFFGGMEAMPVDELRRKLLATTRGNRMLKALVVHRARGA